MSVNECVLSSRVSTVIGLSLFELHCPIYRIKYFDEINNELIIDLYNIIALKIPTPDCQHTEGQTTLTVLLKSQSKQSNIDILN